MNNLIKKIKTHWKDFTIGLLLILILGFLLTGAGSLSSKSLGFESYDMVQSKAMNYGGSSERYYADEDFAPEIEERKVIKNADLSLESDYYDGAKAQIKNSVNAHNIITLRENEYKYRDDYRSVSYTFKIDSSKLELFVNELKTYGEVQNINVYANDVTGTYADYSQRLGRYQLQIEKYKVMLNRENLEIKDEIEIQTRIDQLEDSIFYLTDRMGSIDEDVSYSTVSLSLREEPSIWSEIDFLGLKDGFKMFMESLEAGVEFILMVLGFVIPFGLIYGVYRIGRKFF